MAFFSTLQEFLRTLRYLGSLIALKYLGSLGAALRSTPRTRSSPPSRESSLAKVILIVKLMISVDDIRDDFSHDNNADDDDDDDDEVGHLSRKLASNFFEIICEYL